MKHHINKIALLSALVASLGLIAPSSDAAVNITYAPVLVNTQQTISATDLANSDQASFVSATLSGATPYATASNAAVLFDGAWGSQAGSNYTGVFRPATTANGASNTILTITLNRGYDLSSIVTASNASTDGQYQTTQNYQLEVAQVGSSTFTTLVNNLDIGNANNAAAEERFRTVSVTSSFTAGEATNIDRIRITFLPSTGGWQQDGKQYREIDVFGTAAPDTTPPVITLNGSATVSVNQGATYTDAGATATDNIDPSVTVVTTGTVNTAVVGDYVISYNATDSASNVATTVTRTVTVVPGAVDVTPPTITLNGSATVSVNQGSTYTDAGASATDNVDGSVTVITTNPVDTAIAGVYVISYNATDTAGNHAITVTRNVTVVDTESPVISLNGYDTLTVNLGSSYTDAGATATDNLDGSITVVTTGTVDTAILGEYVLSYNATDVAGNAAATVTRTVTVVDGTPPVITRVGDPIVFVILNASYTDAGATAADNVDSNVTVVTTGTVDTAVLGDYVLSYDATDAAGNIATTVTRTVSVVTSLPPVITYTLGYAPATPAVSSTDLATSGSWSIIQGGAAAGGTIPSGGPSVLSDGSFGQYDNGYFDLYDYSGAFRPTTTQSSAVNTVLLLTLTGAYDLSSITSVSGSCNGNEYLTTQNYQIEVAQVGSSTFTTLVSNLDITNAGNAAAEERYKTVSVTSTINAGVATNIDRIKITFLPSTGNWQVDGKLYREFDVFGTAVGGSTNTFANWMSSNYPGLTTPDNLPGADPEHDGLTNLVEYALNTNPTTSSQPAGTRTGNTLTFTKGAMAKADSNIAYSIDESTDLSTWTAPTGVSPSGTVVNGPDTITYTFPSGPPKVFARLKVVQTP